MKRLVTLIAIIATALFCSGAFAAEYTVKRGDTLSGIAKSFTGKASNYKELAKTNGISNPDRIKVGQKLIVPDGISMSGGHLVKGGVKHISAAPTKNEQYQLNSGEVFLYVNPGRDPYTGSLEQALTLLGYPSEVKEAFKVKVAKDEFSWTELRKGDRIPVMTFGKMKVRRNVVAAWKDPKRIYPSKVYVVENEGKVYRLLLPMICGNWSRLEESQIPRPQVAKETPVPVPLQEPTAKEHFPEPYVAPETREVVDFPEEKPCCPVEHEPIIGLGTWGNGVADGDFAYAEYMLWLKKPVFDCDSPYSWGVGAYGNWDQGDSKSTSYSWSGHAIGPQAGLKYSSVWFDEDDKKYRLEQWVTKLRFVWEDQSGSNSEGYKMHQDSTKLGLYAEYVRELNDKWMGIAVAEGWMGIDSSIKSTWSGDEPSERGQVMLAGYGQYQVNDDWAVRFGGGPFYQQWDDMYGLHLRAEARWKNTIMFGPYANLFVFGKTDAYKGIATSDLHGLGLFARIEFGEPIRQYDRNLRMERVKAADDKRFGVQEM